jgi:hypothetical protein
MRIADLDDEDSNAKVMMQDDSLASQSEEPQHRKQQPLTQGAQLLKERLSHIPLYANKAKGGNDYWNALASSHHNH